MRILRMLALLVSVVPTLAACDQAPAPFASASSSQAPPAVQRSLTLERDGRPPVVDPKAVIGTWSFDRTCASGDAMTLARDGRAGFDEWGLGMWAVDAHQRIVLILRVTEPGTDEDPLAERRVLVFTPRASVTDDLQGQLATSRPGEAVREVNAKRCPSTP